MALLLFVTAGTIGLVLVLNAAFQRWSRSEFEALASANAEFIRVSRLPTTDRLAAYLSQMLGVEVRFSSGDDSDPGRERVTVAIEPGVDLTMVRERPTLRSVIRRPVTVATLTAFRRLWFALA